MAEKEESKQNEQGFIADALLHIARGPGAPPRFRTPEELAKAMASYFEDCMNNRRMPTVARLAIHLGFASRRSMYDYKKKDEFSPIIKAAVTLIESEHEQNLFQSGATGSIFWLKQHAGYEDKTTVVNKNFDLNNVISQFMGDEDEETEEDEDN